MGIRIHKILGFSLESEVDLNEEDLENLTLEDIYNTATEDEKKKLNFDFYQTDLKSKVLDYVYCIRTEVSGLNKNVFALIPPVAEKDWVRYNSVLDYYSFDGIDATMQIKKIYEPVTPYSHHKYIVNKTGLEIDHINADRCRFLDFEKIPESSELNKELSLLGIDCSKSLKEQIHLEPPMFVKLVAKKLNIPENSIFELTLITYWS